MVVWIFLQYVTNLFPFVLADMKAQEVIDPNQLRWKPFDFPTQPTDFVQGLRTIAHAGHATVKHGIAVRILDSMKY